MCRFCATHSDDNFNIFTDQLQCGDADTEEDQTHISYSELCAKYLKLRLDTNTPYPRVGCSDCRDQLKMLIGFFRRVETGQSKLHELLVAEGSIESKKRGRPKKGFEKNKQQQLEETHSGLSTKRKIRIPKKFQDSIIDKDVSEVKENNADVRSEVDGENNSERCEPAEESKSEACYDCDKGNNILYKCNNCGSVLESKSDINNHQTSHGHQDFTIIEVDPPSPVKTETILSESEQKIFDQENTKIFHCDDCSQTFGSASSLVYHKKSIHQLSSFHCPETGCDKKFKLKSLLKNHQKTHSDQRQYACDQCDKSFKTRSNLTTHQVVHDQESKFFCEECGQQFKHRTSLAAHIRWHKGEKEYKCPYCPKTFNQKGNLKEHTRIHTGDRPFKCEVCSRSFTTSSQHRLHMKRHLGVKQFQCDLCSKSFLHNDSLKAHIRRHKGEKPFECDTCKKCFAEAWALTKHKRIHTGVQPYLCKECGKRFADSSNLAKHRKTHDNSGAKVKSMVWNIVKDTDRDTDKVETGEQVEQVIYITYDHDQRLEASDETNVSSVKIVEISEESDEFSVTTKDGAEYRIVAPLSSAEHENITFSSSSDYIKQI